MICVPRVRARALVPRFSCKVAPEATVALAKAKPAPTRLSVSIKVPASTSYEEAWLVPFDKSITPVPVFTIVPLPLIAPVYEIGVVVELLKPILAPEETDNAAPPKPSISPIKVPEVTLIVPMTLAV